MNYRNILYVLPGILVGLTLHEFCHGFAAYLLGDHTAKDEGRLSLNPLKHIDPIGFLFLIIAGFGWAKPVRFNPQNLQFPRRDKAIIAAAGPVSNFILALVFIGLIRGWMGLPDHIASSERTEFIFSILYSSGFIVFMQVLYSAAMINLGLFVFNLFPIPPLDGSHIVFSGLNLSAETEHRIMRIGMPLLFVIIVIQNRTHIDILPIGKIVSALFNFFMPMPG